MRLRKTFAVALAAALILGLCGCAGKDWLHMEDNQLYTGFEPVTPDYVPRYHQEQADGHVTASAWPAAMAQRSDLLPDFGLTTVVRQLSGGAGFKYKEVGGELSAGNYEVIIDQFRFRTEDGDADDGTCDDNSNATSCQMRIEKVRIGVGVRIIAHITVAKAGATIGSLTGIGGNATLENISGTVSAYSYGILPVPIDFRALAANATLKEGIIPAILSSAAGVLDKMQAADIHLIEPRVFAIKRFKPVSETQTAETEVRKKRAVLKLLRKR
jgi:hypothetical protein